MVQSTLAIAGLSTITVAAVYAYVGVRLARTTKGGAPSSVPLRFFSLWWLSTSANQIMGGALYLAAAYGHTDLVLQLTYVHLQRLLLATSLVGLMYYLLFLQTGRNYVVPLALVYAVYFASQVFQLTVRAPYDIAIFAWRTDLIYAHGSSPLFDLVQLIIIAPPVLGALLMMRVYRRVETPTRRFRVAMIGIGFTLWWIVAIAAGQRALFELSWFQAVNRIVGIAVAMGILFAYEPLPWMQRRWGLVPHHAQS